MILFDFSSCSVFLIGKPEVTPSFSCSVSYMMDTTVGVLLKPYVDKETDSEWQKYVYDQNDDRF